MPGAPHLRPHPGESSARCLLQGCWHTCRCCVWCCVVLCGAWLRVCQYATVHTRQQCCQQQHASNQATCTFPCHLLPATPPASPSPSRPASLTHTLPLPPQDDDIPGIVRYHTYEVLAKEVDNPRLRWAYLPYSMHMAGPREAIQHMIIRKNYGCTHFIIGRDMAGCKSTISGEDFYGAYDAQDTAKANAAELGMQTVPSLNIAYTKEKGYVTADVADAENLTQLKLSGTKFRQMLRGGEDIPEWFAFKSVVEVLREQTMAEDN